MHEVPEDERHEDRPPGNDATTAAGTPSRRGRFGSGNRAAIVALYAAMVAAFVVVLPLAFRSGAGLRAPRADGGDPVVGAPATAHGDVLWRLLLAAAVILIVARVVGALFQRFGQPHVVGEITAGILLGPSVLGASWLWPQAQSSLFADEMLPHLDVLAQIGLIFFMFLIGLELDMRLLRGRGRAAVVVSHVSIVAPFVLGVLLALVLYPRVRSGGGSFAPFALFMGASMAITAFPVLARILTEKGLFTTRLGAVAMTCAAVDDVTAWCLLAIVVAVARTSGFAAAMTTIALSIAFIVFMIVAVRPLLARLGRHPGERGQLSAPTLAAIFVGILLSALATDRIGIHAIFGAFLFGAIMPQRSQLVSELVGKLEDFAVVFLLPLFFAYSGLRTEIGLLGGDPQQWLLCGLILLVAIAGKFGGSTIAGRVVGLHWREASALGVLMNCRGLTELVILNVGLELGVIPPELFAMLVIMALVTTFITSPALSLVYPRSVQRAMIQEDSGDAVLGDEDRWTVLVPVAKDATAADLVRAAVLLVPRDVERARVVLVRAVALPGTTLRAGITVQDGLMEGAAEGLRPLVDLVEAAGHEAVPLVVPASADVGDTIAQVANDREPDLVLIGWHRSLFGNRLLGGAVGTVLRDTKADVAVFVDAAGRGLELADGAEIVVPHGGGYHEDVGIELALRLAAGARDATVTLLGPPDADGSRQLTDRVADAYERTGVWTRPAAITGDIGSALLERARTADLLVLGVSDEWIRDQESLGALRGAIAEQVAAPLFIVRRYGRAGAGRWLRRQREWMPDEPVIASGVNGCESSG